MADLPDWTTGVDIIAQTIAELEVDIVAQTVGDIAVDIASQSAGDITVDITAQSVGSIDINIAAQGSDITIDIKAQSVGVKIEAEWQSFQGKWKYFQAYNTSLAFGGSYFGAYAVPAGKTLFITGMAGAWHQVNSTWHNELCRGTVHLYGATGYMAMLGGESGCGITFPTPIRVTAGQTINLYGQSFSLRSTYHWVCFWGYEV